MPIFFYLDDRYEVDFDDRYLSNIYIWWRPSCVLPIKYDVNHLDYLDFSNVFSTSTEIPKFSISGK